MYFLNYKKTEIKRSVEKNQVKTTADKHFQRKKKEKKKKEKENPTFIGNYKLSVHKNKVGAKGKMNR